MNITVPFYRSVATKALGVLALIVITVSLVSGYQSLTGARSLLTGELTERGLVLARNLAINAGYSVYTDDTLSLGPLLDGVMTEPDVLFAVVVDTEGREVAHRVRHGEESALQTVRGRLPRGEAEQAVPEQVDNTEFLLLSAPVHTREFTVADQEESSLIGFLDIGFSPDERLEMAREEHNIYRGNVHLGISTADISAGMGEVSARVTLLSLATILVGIIASGILVQLFIRPLNRMSQVTARVADGDLSAKVDVSGHDELSLLGHAFNKMTESLNARDEEIQKSHKSLAAANQELGDLNAHLEERVAERTRQLRQQSEALKATNRELVEATERKSRFMANLAHELRTPLNSVIGFSEALRDGLMGDLTEKQLKYIHNILTSGRHILEMSGGILDLSKIEAGSIEVHLQPLDVVQALEEIVTITEPQLGSKSLSVEADTSHLDLSRTYMVDRGKFKQVLYNLVSNGIKFSPEGGTLRLIGRTDGDILELRVSDSGPGVPEEDRETVFEEFTQLLDGEQRGGSGLGLSITRKLVELHSGRIWVEETPGGGATFVVRLPENPPPPPGSTASDAVWSS
ncbi:MAG: ATP-binding protein [Leptospirillia bacterium]